MAQTKSTFAMTCKSGRSFLDSFWWGLMTLTTVGYGDLSPSTFPGKLIGKNAADFIHRVVFRSDVAAVRMRHWQVKKREALILRERKES